MRRILTLERILYVLIAICVIIMARVAYLAVSAIVNMDSYQCPFSSNVTTNNIIESGTIKVYIEPAVLETCFDEKQCYKINTTATLEPALKVEGINVVDDKKSANVVIKLYNIDNNPRSDITRSTQIITKFGINDNIFDIVTMAYYGGRLSLLFDKQDWNANAKAIQMVITKLFKNNKVCNNCKIEAKVSYDKEDGKKILEYKDNTGF